MLVIISHPEPQARDRSECHEPRPRTGGIPRSGATLLEVIVALTILATAGLAAVTVTREALHAVQHAREADRDVMRASAFLEVVALWPREDLDQRLGDRPQGPWRLRIDRPLPTLYEVTLSDSARRRAILRTSLYRPEASDAGR